MTCIRFFTDGATSYIQLGEQQVSLVHPSRRFSINLPASLTKLSLPPPPDLTQRWLVRAKEHLRTYLQEQQGRSSGRKKSQVNTFRKMMSSSDVSRLLIICISYFKEMPKD